MVENDYSIGFMSELFGDAQELAGIAFSLLPLS